ncbi:MAG: citrate:proton symporter [Renibacterium salmoninarum]|nr:citrate:proton symporter [Renibacterium salmoninarum]
MILVLAVLLIATVLGLLLWRKISPVVAFVVLPPIAGLLAGVSLSDLGRFIGEGLQTVFPTAVMFIFAVLFFGILRERGLFDPVVNFMVKIGGNDPVRLYIATVLLAAVVHLDGVGPATVLLTIPALLPVYQRLGLGPFRLLLFVGASVGIMNMVPWGGPTARAASALKLDAAALWYPLIPVQAIGLATALLLAVFLGLRDRRKVPELLGDAIVLSRSRKDLLAVGGAAASFSPASATLERDLEAARPALSGVRGFKASYWANLAVLLAVLTVLFLRLLPLNVTFMIGLGLVLLINFRGLKAQGEAIERHARDAINLAVVLLAVSVFLGVLAGTGMVAELSNGLARLFPAAATQYVHLALGALATPIGMVIGPDPYYFGMLPIFGGMGACGGGSGVGVPSAMLLGENLVILLSPMIPVAYLASSLAQVDLAQNIKANFCYLWGISLAMLLAAVLLGVVPL